MFYFNILHILYQFLFRLIQYKTEYNIVLLDI